MRLTRGERRRSWLSLRRGLGGKRPSAEWRRRWGAGGGEEGGNGGRRGSERSVRQKSSASAPCLNYTSSLSASRLPVSEETYVAPVCRESDHIAGVQRARVACVCVCACAVVSAAQIRLDLRVNNLPPHYFPQQHCVDQVSNSLKLFHVVGRLIFPSSKHAALRRPRHDAPCKVL